MKPQYLLRLAKASIFLVLLSLLSSCVVLWPHSWGREHDRDHYIHAQEHHERDDD